MKIIKYISNIIIWTVLGLYLAFILTFEIPSVQEYFGHRLSGALARKLGTSVSIERVDIGIPNSVKLYNVIIRDQKGNDMLVARRLSAKVDLIPLLEGKVSIATAQLLSVNAILYQRDSLSNPNFQFALDSLASKDSTNVNPLDLRINSIIIRNSNVSYDRYDKAETPEKLNVQHLKFSDISAHIILKKLSEDSLNVNIKRLAFKEKSGLKMDRLTMKLTGGRHGSRLEDFTLNMPGTNIQLGDIEAQYIVRGKELVLPSLRYRGELLPSTITLSDLTSIVPSLKTFNSTLLLSSSIEGQGEKLTVPDLSITSTTGDINLNIDGWIKDLDQSEPQWQTNINNLDLSAKTLNFISENLQGERMELPAFLTRLGNLQLTGIAKGEGLKKIDLRSQVNADIGKVNLTFGIDKQRAFNGFIDTKGVNLRKLLNNNQFGLLATNIHLEGRLPADGNPVVNAKGIISQFEYNGYQYRNIDVNGSYSAENIIGKLSINDPNIGLAIEGNIDKEAKTNIVNIKASIDHLSPQAIHLSDKWGDARFNSNITANFNATSLNDAIGSIDINNFTMSSVSEQYQLDSLHIESGYEEETHYIKMVSDFGEVDISGNFDYNTLTQSFTNFLASNLPTLPGLPKVNKNSNNSFVINASINKSDWIEKVFQIPVSLKQPLTLEGMIDDATHNVVIECNIPHFYYQDNGYKGGHISISTPQDSILYDLRIAKLYEDSSKVDLHAFGKAANNNLHTSLEWDNHLDKEAMRGQLNAIGNFSTSFDNKQTAYIQILPSVINIHNSDWNIEPAHIIYSKNYLNIKNLSVRHNQQHLTINGTASESTTDSLFADLIDVDIEYILQLVDFDAVDFSGKASGTGVIRGLFGNPQADAQLRVNDFKFQHGRMGTLYAEVNWNEQEKQIDINAKADDGPGVETIVKGYVSPERNFIDLGIKADGTYLDFAHSFTESFLSKIDGHGNGEVRIIGPLDAVNLTGQLVVNGTTHVKPLGCTYEMRNDTIKMVPNEIEFLHCPIYDIHGHEAILTGGIHHQDLTNMTYDIYVNAKELMAYDFPDFGDETFYGTVYVNGNAAIHGYDNEVVIEADVTPLQNSIFVYNASSPDIITDQQFIQWGKGSDSSGNTGLHAAYDLRSDLNMRIKINATPDATIRLLMDQRTGDYITLRGYGDIQATYYNKGGLNMFGNYEITNGTYNITIQDIIRKTFNFKEGGTIVFGGDPYDAQIDMQAQHIVSGVSLSDLNIGESFSNTVRVNCLMNITGQPRAPMIDFDLDILNVNSDEKQLLRTIINGQEEMRQQVIYLLAVGRFYPQGANNASANESQRNSTSLAMQSLLSGTISGQINSMLSQVIKSRNWNFGANISTGDEGWNNAEYEGIINGRLLNNRLLINGQFGYRDKATTANPSFIGDFDIRYLLLPNGNLALKVYNQTNDRYFTRSSLNTQGISLIMKKDFNGWRDLFGIKRRKEKEKKRQSSEEGSSE